MKLLHRLFLYIGAGVVALSTVPLQASEAKTYPDKLVRIVVPYPSGGPADIITRILSEKLAAIWGKPVVVENRSGAGGEIGSEVVARALPDGYTLLVNALPLIINPLYQKVAYDPFKDFTPVTELASFALILVVHPSVVVRTLDELIALAKTAPGSVTIANGGVGAPSQLCAMLLAQAAGVQLLHVPYKGGGEASSAVVGGQVMAMCDNAANALPQVHAGTLRALAIAGAQRLAIMPEVPSIAELGYPGFEVSGWLGLFAPAGLPRNIAVNLQADIARALKIPDVQQVLTTQGYGVIGSTPEEFAAFLSADYDKWRKLIDRAGLKAN